MKAQKDGQFSRRRLMKAAGASLCVPFFLKRAFAQATPRPSLVLLMQTNGVHQPSFWPTPGVWDSPVLSQMLTDPIVGPKTTLLKGINLNLLGNPAGNGHDFGFHGLYSGYDNVSDGGAKYGGGPSIDQVLIKTLAFTNPFPHIHCGVHAADYRTINAGRVSFSCASQGQQLPCELDVYKLYDKVFAGGVTVAPDDSGEAAAQAALRLRQRQSILDAVSGDLTALQGRLGPTESMKVDAHLTALRDFEGRLSAAAGAGVRPAASCGDVAPFETGVNTGGQNNEANADKLFRLYMEFIANAVACNMVGVLTFQFGRGGEHFHYNWLNIEGMRADFHDEIAHKDDGKDAVAAFVMEEVGKYYTGLVTDLATRLAGFPQEDGTTALDNSLVVWGNEIAEGRHGTNGMPIVLLGGAAGRLTETGYMVDEGDQPHHRFGCALHNIMGNETNGFGAVPDCGVVQGLKLA